jgi:hypothetical protein
MKEKKLSGLVVSIFFMLLADTSELDAPFVRMLNIFMISFWFIHLHTNEKIFKNLFELSMYSIFLMMTVSKGKDDTEYF